MAGFLPVGSFPVASVPAGDGGIIITIPTASITVNGQEYFMIYTMLPTRVTWIGAEVLHTGIYAGRISWIGAEVLHTGLYDARLTWIGVEVLRTIDSILTTSDEGGVFILW